MSTQSIDVPNPPPHWYETRPIPPSEITFHQAWETMRDAILGIFGVPPEIFKKENPTVNETNRGRWPIDPVELQMQLVDVCTNLLCVEATTCDGIEHLEKARQICLSIHSKISEALSRESLPKPAPTPEVPRSGAPLYPTTSPFDYCCEVSRSGGCCKQKATHHAVGPHSGIRAPLCFLHAYSPRSFPGWRREPIEKETPAAAPADPTEHPCGTSPLASVEKWAEETSEMINEAQAEGAMGFLEAYRNGKPDRVGDILDPAGCVLPPSKEPAPHCYLSLAAEKLRLESWLNTAAGSYFPTPEKVRLCVVSDGVTQICDAYWYGWRKDPSGVWTCEGNTCEGGIVPAAKGGVWREPIFVTISNLDNGDVFLAMLRSPWLKGYAFTGVDPNVPQAHQHLMNIKKEQEAFMSGALQKPSGVTIGGQHVTFTTIDDPYVGSVDVGDSEVAALSEAAEEVCPQNHHLKEGDCRYDFCRCDCARCKRQCEEGGR